MLKCRIFQFLLIYFTISSCTPPLQTSKLIIIVLYQHFADSLNKSQKLTNRLERNDKWYRIFLGCRSLLRRGFTHLLSSNCKNREYKTIGIYLEITYESHSFLLGFEVGRSRDNSPSECKAISLYPSHRTSPHPTRAQSYAPDRFTRSYAFWFGESIVYPEY